jgi:hypothetical protein
VEFYFGIAVIVIILLVGFWGMTHGLGEVNQQLEVAIEEDKRALQRLVNVAGADSWSSDDRHLRLQQLKRRKERLELAFLPDIQQRLFAIIEAKR